MENVYHTPPIPSSFIWKRAHSLTGIWLVLFLMEHLFINSQAALLIGDDGNSFVRAVNSIRDLPYLPVIEIVFLAIPFFIHGIWGIKYIFSAKYNSFQTDGSDPAFPEYPRNQAYTWQRITSWILLFGILAHVIQMRFIEYPVSAEMGSESLYMVQLNKDEGLYPLSKRLGFEIYNSGHIEETHKHIQSLKMSPVAATPTGEDLLILEQREQELDWLAKLEKFSLNENQVVAVSKTFGVAELLMVRDTFKDPLMIILYTGLVLAACFHAFNGLWSAMINMGITLTATSQRIMRKLAVGLMVIITFMGLAAIWGSYASLYW
jgi:succinate dehydrogenase / fumarate reductase, cytochrome b subunit